MSKNKGITPLEMSLWNKNEELLARIVELEDDVKGHERVVKLLHKRFPQKEDGSFPDWKIEDVIRNERLLREALEDLVHQCKEGMKTSSEFDFIDLEQACKILALTATD